MCWLFIFKVTEPNSIPYGTHPACAKWRRSRGLSRPFHPQPLELSLGPSTLGSGLSRPFHSGTIFFEIFCGRRPLFVQNSDLKTKKVPLLLPVCTSTGERGWFKLASLMTTFTERLREAAGKTWQDVVELPFNKLVRAILRGDR